MQKKKPSVESLPGKLRFSGIKPTKKLGQHFLFDEKILKKIVEAVPDIKGKKVLEIGPGPGSLTSVLLKHGAHVIAIEKDHLLANFLEENIEKGLAGNLEVFVGDALEFDLAELTEKPEILVSNLPYNIAATLIVDYLEKYEFLSTYVVTVQHEVALRLSAKPKTEHYGSLSLKVQSLADVELLFKIKPGSFYPPPKVDSQVVRIKRSPKIEKAMIDDFFKFLDKCFAYRRKTLVNNFLKSELFKIREEARNFLACLNFNEKARPEELGLDDYLLLFKAFLQIE